MTTIKKIVLFFLLIGIYSGAAAQQLPEFHFNIENMKLINSRFSELSIMPLNDTTYLLVSDRGGKDKYNKWIGGVPYDMFYVNRKDWLDIYKPVGLNTKFSDGPVTLKNAEEMYVTQTNNRGQVDDKTGAFIYRLNISRATWDGETWDLEEIKDFKHKEYSFAHPTISSDGKSLYYVSDKPGGMGGKDIYVSQWTEDGWSHPKNLGETVNSNRDESFPFLHAGGRLYFCSDRKGGMGGLDIYYTYKTGDIWEEPKNIGTPINSRANDYSVYFNDAMERGFFASNRLGGRGGEDVYAIFVDKILEDEEPDIKEAEVTELNDTPTAIEPSSPTARAEQETVDLQANRELVLMDQSMRSEDLRNVYFSIGSHTVDEEGAMVMNRLAQLLEQYEDPVIELHAHADATGSYAENILLTEKRARSVMQYLIGKGVPMSRMSYRAYGESSLLLEQEEDVRINRRVEFRLKFYQHPEIEAEKPDEWPGYGIRDMVVLEPYRFYVQLAAMGQSSMFSGYKLKEFGTTVCYFQGGLYKYVLGPYPSLEVAREKLREVKNDYRDAFIFRNY